MVCDAGEFGNPAAGGVKYMKYSTRLRLVEYFIYFTPGPVYTKYIASPGSYEKLAFPTLIELSLYHPKIYI